MSVPNTGGYQKWQTVLARDVSIAAGDHVLRVKMDVASTSGSVGNFDYVQISEAVVPPPTKIVQTTTTAYVQDGTSANTNFGSSTQLIVKKYAGTGYTRESFLKFDLSTLTTITSAKLRLFGRLNDTSQPSLDVGVAYTDSQSWTEGGITWNNRPTATTGLTTVTVSGTTAQWYEIDVTDFLKAQKALGHNTVTIVLKNATASTAYATFNSDDAATNRPELLVET